MSVYVRRSVIGAVLATGALALSADTSSGRFELSTKSADARTLLAQLQTRVENFQVGPESVALARKLEQADPQFALGVYMRGAWETDNDASEAALKRSYALAKQASDGERRFLEAMEIVNANNGADFAKGQEPLEKLSRDYPNERRVFVILGQIYRATGQPDKARAALLRAEQIGPTSARVRSLLADDDVLNERYAQARATYAEIEKALPKGSVPFAIRFGTAFSHLYEDRPDAALAALQTYLAEYKQNGADQNFPEVFIWNAIARINLEHGRLPAALEAYEKGYASVPGSTLPEDQKQTWYGRLRHGKARTLAKQGKTKEAWAEAEAIKKMIEDGGEPAKQYWPAYHYVAGYVKLEAGDATAAVEHLKQASADDPFHVLLLARAYEQAGDKAMARQTYATVVASRRIGMERALAYPEAKRRLALLKG